MSFIIPPEELTTDGPYKIGAVRPLSFMEIAYTELMLQMELLRGLEEDYVAVFSANHVEDLPDSQSSMVEFLRHPGPANLNRTPTPLVQPVPPAPGSQAALGPQGQE